MRVGIVRRSLAVAALAGSMLFVAAPLATASDLPVEAGMCPVGWYGVWAGYQTPTGERWVIVCIQA